jgi:hypothetical protein
VAPASGVELARLANATGLEIQVCHFPPYTSNWNKFEHGMFSFVSPNWRGKPLESLEVIINLIAQMPTASGLKSTPRSTSANTSRAAKSQTTNSPLSTSRATHATVSGTTS